MDYKLFLNKLGLMNIYMYISLKQIPLPAKYIQLLLKEPEEGENPFPLGLSELRR